jgi:anaerobic magnesium-protoporphyrin IX monomethyl ester cyclase
MKVLFVELEMDRDWSIASVGPAFLASYVRPLGYQVDIIHLQVDVAQETAIQQILEYAPDVLALSLTTRQWLRAKGIVNTLRTLKHIPTIVGGLHPTFSSESVLEEWGIDYVCLGEGELAFANFLETLKNNKPIVGLKNIRCKGDPRPKMYTPYSPIDSLPFMARNLLNENNGVYHMTTQRGCPFPCSYCAARMYNEMYGTTAYGRRRSISNVMEEIRSLNEKEDLSYIIFLDDTFTINHKWVNEFCDVYGEEFGVGFSLHARVETINEALINRLAKAGCKHITFGVESGSVRVRTDIMKRRVTNQRLIDAFRWSQNAGILTTANYIIGTPTETRQDIEDTLALHKQINPDDFGYFVFYPYPGTPMYHYCKERGLLPDDMFDRPANHRTSILNHDVLTPEDIEEYYERFTRLREQNYFEKYGQYLTPEGKDSVTKQMNKMAETG